MNQNASNIIDPHLIFKNGQSVDLADLTFFAELKVIKRSRLNTSNRNNNVTVINFLGGNKNKVTGKNEFTTRWTDNEENIGIKSINYTMTSSYVPQVDIVLEDIRGQSLFNNFVDSAYKILLDFPPPIFELTLKGYYGKPVTYKLHKTNLYTKFVDNSYEVHVSFVGMTFAPLADFLVDYLEVAPYLINNSTALVGEVNTYLELKRKAQDLVSQIKSTTEEDSKELRDISNKSQQLEDLVRDDFIVRFQRELNDLSVDDAGQNNPLRVTRDKTNRSLLLVELLYNKNTKSYYIENDNYSDVYDRIQNKLSEYKRIFTENNIVNKINTLPDKSNLPENIKGINTITNHNVYVTVLNIDLTNVNENISNKIKENENDLLLKRSKLNQKTSGLVYREISGGPTLRNVLKIIMNDAKAFYKELINVVKNAEANRIDNEDLTNGEAPRFAFPKYKIIKNNGDGNQVEVLSIPKNRDWDEVKFVNKYINSKMQASSYLEETATFDKQNTKNYDFTPINPFDNLLFTTNNVYSSLTIDAILETIVKRANVLIKQSYNLNKNLSKEPSRNVRIVKIYGKLEALNIIKILKNNTKLLNVLINMVGKKDFSFTKVDNLFNNSIATSNVTSIEGATNNIIYSASKQFSYKDAEFFSEYLGIPEAKNEIDLNGDDKLTKNLKELNDELDSTILTRLVTTKPVLSQYNVPLYKDNDLKDSSGAFANKSDYVKFTVPIIQLTDKNTSEYLNTHTPEEFLHRFFIEPLIVKQPFEMSRFNEMGAIHEVPFFILAVWGYILKNISILSDNSSTFDRTKWESIPSEFKIILLQSYEKFIDYFTVNKQTIILDIKEGENGDRAELYESDFFKFLCEIKYIILGDTLFFNGKTDKIINFSDDSDDYILKVYNEYFNILKNELLNNKNDVLDEIKSQKEAVDAVINNDDLKTQLYYTFKSFVDKWVLDYNSLDLEKIFDVDETFIMVDRGFNDIGDKVILDLEPIYSLDTSPNTSLYTLLLNLLTKNNFEFFALPSYVDYRNGDLKWNLNNVHELFGIYNGVGMKSNPKFICMYVGGTSAQLDIPKMDNSISHNDDSAPLSDIKDLNKVQAFAVNIGTTNQSFFTGVDLDQSEYKETNESINILDRIAKSQGHVTETSSNSMYEVYEQRSNSIKFTMMGNVMIQPTMYFDLQNVAMFKGAYLILEVTHNVVPNSMTTTVKGVRIPKFMKPYVTDYTILANIDMGTSLGYSTINTTNVAGGGVTNSDIKDIQSAIPFLGKVKITKDLKDNSITNKEKALLDMLSYAEGTLGKGFNGYDILFTNKRIPIWKPDYEHGHGNKAWLNSSNGVDSTAAGRYQFLYNTWAGYSVGEKHVIGEDSNKYFSEKNQDLTALRIIKEKRLNVFGFDINKIERENFIHYIDVLALEWASLPFYGTIKVKSKNPSWSVGKGFYSGQGGKYTADELWVVYYLALRKYEGSIDSGNDLKKALTLNLGQTQLTYINELHPNVKEKFKSFIAAVQNETGYYVEITSGYRSYEKQVNLGNQNPNNADGNYSLHRYGLAIDVNLRKNGVIVLTKDSSISEWKNTGIVNIANRMGFIWGGEFINYYDPVHFEIKNQSGGKYSGYDLYKKAEQIFGAVIKDSDFNGTKVNI